MKILISYENNYENNVARIEIGPVIFHIDQPTMDRFARTVEGGNLDLIFRTDLIENRFVESMEVNGLIYTKADLRQYIADYGPKKPSVPLH